MNGLQSSMRREYCKQVFMRDGNDWAGPTHANSLPNHTEQYGDYFESVSFEKSISKFWRKTKPIFCRESMPPLCELVVRLSGNTVLFFFGGLSLLVLESLLRLFTEGASSPS